MGRVATLLFTDSYVTCKGYTFCSSLALLRERNSPVGHDSGRLLTQRLKLTVDCVGGRCSWSDKDDAVLKQYRDVFCCDRPTCSG